MKNGCLTQRITSLKEDHKNKESLNNQIAKISYVIKRFSNIKKDKKSLKLNRCQNHKRRLKKNKEQKEQRTKKSLMYALLMNMN
jgi:hypothetical protein